jgi:hypothetical protein
MIVNISIRWDHLIAFKASPNDFVFILKRCRPFSVMMRKRLILSVCTKCPPRIPLYSYFSFKQWWWVFSVKRNWRENVKYKPNHWNGSLSLNCLDKNNIDVIVSSIHFNPMQEVYLFSANLFCIDLLLVVIF